MRLNNYSETIRTQKPLKPRKLKLVNESYSQVATDSLRDVLRALGGVAVEHVVLVAGFEKLSDGTLHIEIQPHYNYTRNTMTTSTMSLTKKTHTQKLTSTNKVQ